MPLCCVLITASSNDPANEFSSHKFSVCTFLMYVAGNLGQFIIFIEVNAFSLLNPSLEPYCIFLSRGIFSRSICFKLSGIYKFSRLLPPVGKRILSNAVPLTSRVLIFNICEKSKTLPPPDEVPNILHPYRSTSLKNLLFPASLTSFNKAAFEQTSAVNLVASTRFKTLGLNTAILSIFFICFAL